MRARVGRRLTFLSTSARPYLFADQRDRDPLNVVVNWTRWPIPKVVTRLAVAWVAFAAALASATCGRPANVAREDTSPATATSAPVPPIHLPDLSGAAEAVRAQIVDRYRTLTSSAGGGPTSSANLAVSYGELGKVLLAANYYDAAEAAFLNAQALAASDARWPYYLGHVHRRRNDPLKAVAAFAQARALEPQNVSTLVWIGEMQLGAGQTGPAAASLEEALAREPHHPRAIAALGRVALARRDYTVAAARLEEALRLAPNATALYYPLSLAYRALGNAPKAEAHLRQRGISDVVMFDPLMDEATAALNSAMAYDDRSRLALARGDWTVAATQARRGLELVGDNSTLRAALHHRLGTALAQTGDRPGAQREFERAVEAAPDFAAGHYSLGILFASGGKRDAAIREFSAALQRQPGYLPARLALADILRQSGRAAEALSEYSRALATEPGSPAAQYGEALALVHLNRHAEARAKLTLAIAQHPNDPALTLALARLLAASSDSHVRDPNRALAIAEPLVRSAATLDGLETVAMALAALGRFDEAAALQRQAAAEAQRTGQAALARAMTLTRKAYERHQVPEMLWREEPLYGPPP